MDFKGLVVAVTGGAKGIGKAIAQQFALRGARVAILDINAAAGEALAQHLRERGADALFVHADVGNLSSMEHAAQQVAQTLGNTDIVCSNAGIYPQALLETMTEADWDTVHRVNLKGMFFTVKAFLPQLKQSARGRIVLISSITGPITGFPGWAHYGATKVGMLGFMRSAALEV